MNALNLEQINAELDQIDAELDGDCDVEAVLERLREMQQIVNGVIPVNRIAQALDVSVQRVRQIEKYAIVQARHTARKYAVGSRELLLASSEIRPRSTPEDKAMPDNFSWLGWRRKHRRTGERGEDFRSLRKGKKTVDVDSLSFTKKRR